MPLGICIALACVAVQAPAQITVFHNFATDKLQPTSGLTEIADGVFVGGALRVIPPLDVPVFYGLTRSGALTGTVTLPAPSCGPAILPGPISVGQPIQASDGNFYGAVGWRCSVDVNGYVYRLSFRGRPPSVTVLRSFLGALSGDKGILIVSSLLEGLGGDLWGAEKDGVFRLSKTGIYNLFSTGPFVPSGDFALGADGSIYGSAKSYTNTMLECAIFQIPGPVLHGYPNPSPEGFPGPVILGTDGLLYGATGSGGANSCGTLFQLDPSNGAYTQLLDMPAAVCIFSGGVLDPFQREFKPLVEAAPGSLYSFYGVAFDTASLMPTVFGYSPRGVVGGVHSFGPINDSVFELTQPVSGGIVGTASGSAGSFAYAISGPAPEPVITAFSQNSGAPGTTIVIRGNYLLGTTVVNFNSISASYHVASVNSVVATVPVGATTGPVTLGTPHGTAVSPMSFTVP
jgi:uncharacterized repeat protein (TIGR03803 family)